MSMSTVYRPLLVVLVAAMLLVPGVARADFGIVPGSFTAGTFQSDGSGAFGEGATPDTQAGDHPYEATTSFELNTIGTAPVALPDGNVKDVALELPPGFVGNPNATPQCPQAVLIQTGSCPNDTIVGETHVTLEFEREDESRYLPVYNVLPARGEIALFVFHFPNPSLDISIHIGVRSAGDYGLTATVSTISQAAVAIASTTTLWGVPADPSHDPYRGESCLNVLDGSSRGGCPSDAQPRPLLTNPALCDGQSLTTTLSVDSWENPGVFETTSPAVSPPVTGCNLLSFDPSLGVAPETRAGGSPSGYSVDLHIPQSEDPNGLATPELKNATVTLPVGVAISPAAGAGLEGCTPAQIAIGTENPVACPGPSKLATVLVSSPSLPRNADGSEGALTGFVYLGEPSSGQITGPPYTIYLVVEGYGLDIKLAGRVSPDPLTGQLITTFTENPQLPFDDLKLDFFGGPRAALANPPGCGTYTTTSSLEPYSGGAATPSSSFQIGEGCSARGFAPSFTAGTTSSQAGAYSPFSVSFSRTDQDQDLSAIQVQTPAGLLGMLSSVPLCGEAQANAGTCSSASQIGHTTAGAGSGSEPLYLPQAGQPQDPVYLTGPYRGAPFGLSVVVPAVAGPFNLGTVVVRAAISVDPHTAQVTITSDPLPTILKGVPLQVKAVNVTVDRPGFMFNPTNCAAQSVNATLLSTQGAAAGVASRFQAADCATLPFKPSFTVSTAGKASKANGASLVVKIASKGGPGAGGGEANIAKVDLQIPKLLPARLTTLQKACTAAQFESDPAGCPKGSVVGTAVAVSPALRVPLAGPAIFVSHGGAAFPDLEFVLQGEGVTLVIDGKTDIKKGITYSKNDTVPDAPISSFEARLPQGPHSVLAAPSGNLCGKRLVMPTTITGQNGAVIKQSTKIAVTGCPKTTRASSRAKKASKRRKKAGR